ncbi:MAG: ATP-dependent sacrificial sulfur transferase LarE [Planctomycetes bacterium]|nr:ATP-dependent sacrificial sulfur transferase LarE [Planctomycetota bacterium]
MKTAPHKDINDKTQGLLAHLKNYKKAIVAYSGGVDSALLAYMANKALGKNMLAVIADSPSLGRRELQQALDFTTEHDIATMVIKTHEMNNGKYLANTGDRCYHCKQALFSEIKNLRQQLFSSERKEWTLLFGANADDSTDYRPGSQAAEEHLIQAPFVDLSISKEEIRDICRLFELNIAEKPAMPCLSSRIPHGEKVSLEKLKQIEEGEDFLKDLGLTILRVRHHGDLARIEVPLEAMPWVMEHKEEILKRFKEIGFLYITLDLSPFSSGSLNVAIGK